MTEPVIAEARRQLPAEFVARLEQIMQPADLRQTLASMVLPKRVAFRVNTLRSSTEQVRAQLQRAGLEYQRVPWLDVAATVAAGDRARLMQLPEYQQGAIYLQGLSSMLAVVALQPKPGEQILDLAAAPGGKTALLAALTGNAGAIAAVEAIRGRFFKLKANLQHLGVEHVRCFLADGRGIGRKTPARFDRVLLDAPCSSESRFHMERPASWSRWSLRKIREQSRKQIGLLVSALRALRPGGELVYCTCSFAPEENERVVQKLLDRYQQAIQVLPVNLPATVENLRSGLGHWQNVTYSDDVRHCCRVVPNPMMDGFFICRIRKLETLDEPIDRLVKSRAPGSSRHRRKA